MSHPLVTTKLRPPRTRSNLVTRPRLREALDRGEERKLTLVSAPAGFGKTTLLAEWLEEHSEEDAVAWVYLEGPDNDPARFVAYLVGGIQEVEGAIGEVVLASMNLQEAALEEAVVGVVGSDLAEPGREVTVVVDD